jgi:hypothetical protein
MTIKLGLGYKKKNGFFNVIIRFKDGDNDKRFNIKGISIERKYWDATNSTVRTNHPNYEDINEILDKYKLKIVDITTKYSLGNIDYNTACKMLLGGSKTGTIANFIDTFCEQDKSEITLKNYRLSMSAFSTHTGIKEPKFSDINYANISKMRKSILDKDGSPHTHNKYFRDIKSICSYALKRKQVFTDFSFDKDWGAKTKPITHLKTVQSFEIKEAIERIAITSTHKSSRMKAARELEAVGFWLLMFSMRGMYPADISALSSKYLAYSYKSKIDIEKKGGIGHVSLGGNRHLYQYYRQKTDYPMLIFITIPPVSGLIHTLRYLVSFTHPEVSYLSKDEASEPDYDELIKMKQNYDPLSIFNYDHKSNLTDHKNLWGNYSKHLKKIGMPDFKSARKTFMTTATSINIPQAICRTLLGQKDPTISAHYNNFNDPALILNTNNAHLDVLDKFDTIELYDLWLFKIDELFKTKFSSIALNASSYNVYNEFSLKLPEFLSETSVKVEKS